MAKENHIVHHGADYYANSDVDWFYRINEVNIHVASMGRQLPEGVENTLPTLYEQVSQKEMAPWKGLDGVWYNEELLRTWMGMEETEAIARYLYTFVVMARKGFYSFAPATFDFTDGDYYLMAKPRKYVDWNLEGVLIKEVNNLNLSEIDAFDGVPLVEMINQ